MSREVIQQALTFLEYHSKYWNGIGDHPQVIAEALRAELENEKCWCTTCRPTTMTDMRFVVCPDCGNKRCPKAHNHVNKCTGSNDVGQIGSSWESVK